MSAKVIELVIFKIKPDVSEEAFVKAAEKTWPAIKQMAGYVDRQLAVDEQGQWSDIVYWTDMEAAQTAAAAVMQMSEFADFISMIDESQLSMRHLDIVAG